MPAAAGAQELDPAPTVIVTAPRGTILPADRELDENGIAAYGADNVGDLLNILALGEDGSGEGPVVLINGEPASGINDVGDLPTEAVSRVQLLTRGAAAALGQRPTRRVINVVIKPDHRQLTLLGKGRIRSAGASGSGEVNLLKLAGGNRRSLVARAETSDRLTEEDVGVERLGVPGDTGDGRTLLPARTGLSVNANALQKFGRHSVGVNAKAEREERRARVGRTIIGGLAVGDPNRQETHSTLLTAGIVANGPLGRWRYSAIGNVDRREAETSTEPQPGKAESRTTNGGLQLLANGPVAALPAGVARLATRLEWRAQSGRSLAASPSGERRFERIYRTAQASLQLPLLSGKGTGIVGAEFTGALRRATGSGWLVDRAVALDWDPNARWSMRLSCGLEQIPPPTGVLGDVPLVTERVPVFDFVRGETVFVRTTTGGNPGLDPERRRQFSAGLTARPARGLDLTVDYRAIRSSGAFAALPPATAEIEAAFPDRFTRDAAGRLIAVDLRPIGFAAVRREEVRSGLTLNRALGSRSGGDGELGLGTRLSLVLQHSWTLRTTRQARRGLPVVNLLDGGAIGYGGGQPRHRIDANAGIVRNGIGLQFDANYVGPSSVASGSLANPDELRFGARTSIDLRLFANLGPLLPSAPFAKGARIAFEVGNLFDSRTRVRNRAGQTPDGYQARLLDPLGRTVGLTLRKAF